MLITKKRLFYHVIENVDSRYSQKNPSCRGKVFVLQTSILPWGHVVRCRSRLLSAVEHATGSIDELSTNDELRQLVRRVETSLIAATLVVRRQLVDAACGVLDSRQNIQTTTNDVASWGI